MKIQVKRICLFTFAIGLVICAVPDVSAQFRQRFDRQKRNQNIKLPNQLGQRLPDIRRPPKLGGDKIGTSADLYIAGLPDMTRLNNRRLFVRIGNKGGVVAKSFYMNVYFWTLKKGADGKTRGKITAVKRFYFGKLNPGQSVTRFPKVSGSPVSYSVKIDPENRVRESREDNNRTGRRWMMYPDAFLRMYSYDPAP